MKLIVGLGNPGLEYQNTRHNAGFMVLDEVAKKCEQDINQKKFQSLIHVTMMKGEKIILMKPQTYMNVSGDAVLSIVNYYKLDLRDIVIVYDDMDLSVGTIRLREKGSSGGQKGMKDIIQKLQCEHIPRIRIGIGKSSYIPVVDYVLGKIPEEDKKQFIHAVDIASDAIIYYMNHTFQETMNQFNK